jgi:O-antigen ligase
VIPPADPFESFSWGILPMLSLITTLTLASLNLQGEVILRKAYSLVMGLLPISLGLWYYKTIFEFNHDQVYFNYDHAIFFLSDGLALLAVIFWLAAQTKRKELPRFFPVLKLAFALCSWITLSALWSADWRTSLYIAIHFWLIFFLILSLREWHWVWSSVLKGFCAALIFQCVIGIIEFNLQSHHFLAAFGLHWPGLIDATSAGASILKFADGQNFLRVYGTILLLLIPGPILLVVTFSRAAWIGAVVFFLLVMIKLWHSEHKKIVLIFSITAVAALLALIPLRQLFISRTTAPTTPTEEFSLVGRIWLSGQALIYAKERPLTGVGIGSFVIQLAEREGERNFVEPVHNVPLLVISELGIVGLVLLFMIFLSIGREFLATKRVSVILISGLLAGMGTIALFDHYFWSLAPGRMMLGLTFGLWLGQVANHDE